MAVLRKIALGLLLAAAACVLVMATWQLWNYQQRGYVPIQSRVDLLTRRVGDMELLVLTLLGTSGLYAIVFAISSYFSATSFARQADQTIGHIQDQIGLAMGDLRELQEETEQRVHQITAPAPAPAPVPASPKGWELQIAEITARLAQWQDRTLGEQERFELMQDESMAAYLEVAAFSHGNSSLAGLYLGFGRIYASTDSARSRFYLERALRLAAPESAVASEIHYQLACRYAESHVFTHAMRELTAAFEHQFKTLEERLASDIEEGGKLYELASTAPFDKSVNDLLLNMSIGIG
jgi:hypothetical protein